MDAVLRFRISSEWGISSRLSVLEHGLCVVVPQDASQPHLQGLVLGCLSWPPVSSSLGHWDFLVMGTGLAEGKGLQGEKWTSEGEGKKLGVALEGGQGKSLHDCAKWMQLLVPFVSHEGNRNLQWGKMINFILTNEKN